MPAFCSAGSGVFALRIAPAVEIRLREDVGLRRLRLRLRVDERDLERRRAVLNFAEIERTEPDREEYAMQHDRRT